MKNFFILILITSLVSCAKNDCSLCGTWQDFSSKYKGDIIEIKQLNDTLVAISLKVSEISKEKGFVVGDIKWKNIVKQDSTIYSFETLGKRTEKGQVIETLYFPWMLKQTDLDTINIFLRTEDNPNRRYVRIK